MDQLMLYNAMAVGRTGNGTQPTIVGIQGTRFNNTLAQLEQKFSGKSHVLFNECTFADAEVSLRCSACDEHIAWTRDIINKPARCAKSNKQIKIPGHEGRVLVQWFRNDQDSNLEVITICGGNMKAKKLKGENAQYCSVFGGKQEYGHCLKCGQQVGWVESNGDETFYALWMARVTYN